MSELAHLTQHGKKYATKGSLMTALDGVYGGLPVERQEHFLRVAVEEAAKQSKELGDELDASLRRLGWQLLDGRLLPLELIEQMDLEAVPADSREDLLKAAQRFRDGDLSGAITAACGAVDSACARVYAAHPPLGHSGDASFQEKVSKSLEAHGTLTVLETELSELGWPPEGVRRFRENLKGSLNQAAYIMQTLRSRMGDVHGSKPTLEALVFDSIKWATIIVSMLK